MYQRTKGDVLFMYFESVGFELFLNVPDVLSVPASGDAQAAVRALVNIPFVATQLNAVGHENIAASLREYGTWTEEELAVESDSRERAVWLAVCSMRDELVETGLLDIVQERLED